MILSAARVFPVSSPPLDAAGVRWHKGVIDEVGPVGRLLSAYPGDRHVSFPDCVVIPGLVNCHTHLEYSCFRAMARPGDFVPWIRRLVRLSALRERFWGRKYWGGSAATGVRLSLSSGITTVGDVVTFGGGLSALEEGGIRARAFLETVAAGESGREARLEALRGRLAGGRWEKGRLRPGISPHSIYTLSPGVLGSLSALASSEGLPLSIHVAESPHERSLLGGRGPLSPLIDRWGLPFGPSFTPSFTSYLARCRLLGPGTLLVHGVQLTGGELGEAARSGATLVTCPRSNLLLRCGLPDYPLWAREGVRFVYGTDSLASVGSFDLFEEARTVRRSLVEGGERILRRLTLGGAEALGLDGVTGSLQTGKEADLVVLRLKEAAAVTEEELVEGASPSAVAATLVGGTFLYRAGADPSTAGDRALSLDREESSTAVRR